LNLLEKANIQTKSLLLKALSRRIRTAPATS
jgi:hypothetical protein